MVILLPERVLRARALGWRALPAGKLTNIAWSTPRGLCAPGGGGALRAVEFALLLRAGEFAPRGPHQSVIVSNQGEIIQ